MTKRERNWLPPTLVADTLKHFFSYMLCQLYMQKVEMPLHPINTADSAYLFNEGCSCVRI